MLVKSRRSGARTKTSPALPVCAAVRRRRHYSLNDNSAVPWVERRLELSFEGHLQPLLIRIFALLHRRLSAGLAPCCCARLHTQPQPHAVAELHPSQLVTFGHAQTLCIRTSTTSRWTWHRTGHTGKITSVLPGFVLRAQTL